LFLQTDRVELVAVADFDFDRWVCSSRRDRDRDRDLVHVRVRLLGVQTLLRRDEKLAFVWTFADMILLLREE
jgi:hypothetical protein